MAIGTEPQGAGDALAERQLREDVRLRERELALKEADLELRRREATKGWLASPSLLALAAAALGLGGNALVAWYNASAALRQEAAKAEYARVLEMIKVGSPELASKNLEMLLQTGLYTDRDGKLQRYIDEHRGGRGAFLPVPSTTPVQQTGRPSAQDNALLDQALRSDAASWMKVAQKEIGVRELPGKPVNPRIAAYQRAAGLPPDESLPWVGSFMCWTFKRVDMTCPENPASALSWANWGQAIDKPKLGAIAVFRRSTGAGGTVGFYLSEDAQKVRILVGNVSNQVGVVSVPKNRIVGYRWPAKE